MSRCSNRSLAGAVVALSICAMASSAMAYMPSKQYGAFELRFGPYRPAVDDNPSLAGQPYNEVFSGNQTMFLTSLELDWQFIHPPGFSLGLGGSIGFMQTHARSLTNVDGASSETGDSEPGRSDADYTVLNVMPFAILLVLRIDALPEYLNVPLAPYFKIGFNWYLWWALDGGDLASVNGHEGRGGTLGWQLAPGLAFQLDGLDRSTARTFDNEMGVNHSYLFVELLWAYVNRFGNDDYLNLSTDTFANATVMAGLTLEF